MVLLPYLHTVNKNTAYIQAVWLNQSMLFNNVYLFCGKASFCETNLRVALDDLGGRNSNIRFTVWWTTSYSDRERERDKEIEQKTRFLYFNLSGNIFFSVAWVSAHTKVSKDFHLSSIRNHFKSSNSTKCLDLIEELYLLPKYQIIPNLTQSMTRRKWVSQSI